jgi:hypothetical protein
MDNLLHTLLDTIESQNLSEGDYLLATNALKDVYSIVSTTTKLKAVIKRPVQVSFTLINEEKNVTFTITSICKKMWKSTPEYGDTYFFDYEIRNDSTEYKQKHIDQKTAFFEDINLILFELIKPTTVLFTTRFFDSKVYYTEWKEKEEIHNTEKDWYEYIIETAKQLCRTEATDLSDWE